MERTEKRPINHTINFFKAVACMGVVLIHCKLPGVVGEALRTLARFAVPFFTMISGFYFWNARDASDTGALAARTKKKLKHIGALIVGAESFALLFCVPRAFLYGEALGTALSRYVTPYRWIKLICVNAPLSYTHFWFLYALLYCYLAAFVLCRCKLVRGYRAKAGLAVILFLMGYAMCALSGAHIGWDFRFAIGFEGQRISLYNVFLFRSFPFFLLGMALRECAERIGRLERLSPQALMRFVAIGGVLSLAERACLGDFQVYLGTFGMVLALFIYCIRYPNGLHAGMERIGQELSMVVYIVHVSVIEVLDSVGWHVGITESAVFQWLRPVVVIALSLCIARACCAAARAMRAKANAKRSA